MSAMMLRIEVWWARRWFDRMTLRQVQVISKVTGVPAEAVVRMHPALRARRESDKLAA